MDETDARLEASDYWDSDDDHPVSDWQGEVVSGDTLMGYHEWLKSQKGKGNNNVKPIGIENIWKAAQSMEFVCNNILCSYKHATVTETIILNEVGKTANELRIQLESFQLVLEVLKGG